jgi:hypothetical protein
MIRFRSTVTAQYGHFAQLLSLSEQLNEIAGSRGWQQGRFFSPVAGDMNVLITQVDYPDLATWDAHTSAAMTDPEWMKVFRSMAEHVYPQSAHTELLDEAPHLA